MGPEQRVGDPLTAATDLWSLGAIAFEALTGHALVERRAAEDYAAVVLRAYHLDVNSRLGLLRERLGPSPHGDALARLVADLLADDPEARPGPAVALRRLQECFATWEPREGRGLLRNLVRAQDEWVDAALPPSVLEQAPRASYLRPAARGVAAALVLLGVFWLGQSMTPAPEPPSEPMKTYTVGTEVRHGALDVLEDRRVRFTVTFSPAPPAGCFASVVLGDRKAPVAAAVELGRQGGSRLRGPGEPSGREVWSGHGVTPASLPDRFAASLPWFVRLSCCPAPGAGHCAAVDAYVPEPLRRG